MMKNISTALIFVLLLVSCKGNTIFEEPIDLIPKDSMVLVLKDLYLASAAKGVKNKKQQKSDQSKAELTKQITDFINSDKVEDIKSSSVSKEEAKTKVNQFFS